MSLAALRQRIADILDPPRGDTGVLPTGIAALDAVLSGGGVPRGRLTEVCGAWGSGKTTLVRHFVASAVATRCWVAWVDAARTLAPRDLAEIGATGLLWVVRPMTGERGAWSADVLLRSGAFGLVVLDGAPPLSRDIAVRLTRLAKESDAGFVVVRDDASRASAVGSALRLRVDRQGAGAFAIVVEKGGLHQSVEVSCVVDVARRLCAHSEVPDRRGVATRNRRGERAGPDVPGARRREQGAESGERRPGNRDAGAGRSNASPPAIGSTLPRKRRFAEPAVKRNHFLIEGTGSREPGAGNREAGSGNRKPRTGDRSPLPAPRSLPLG